MNKYQITHHKSSPYYPQTNSVAEAANKNIKLILQKMIKSYEDWHWHEKLPYAL